MRTGKGEAVVLNTKRHKIGAKDKTFNFDVRIQSSMSTTCHPDKLLLQGPPVVVERPPSIGSGGVVRVGSHDTPETNRVEAL
jgi:hypothetical protein